MQQLPNEENSIQHRCQSQEEHNTRTSVASERSGDGGWVRSGAGVKESNGRKRERSIHLDVSGDEVCDRLVDEGQAVLLAPRVKADLHRFFLICMRTKVRAKAKERRRKEEEMEEEMNAQNEKEDHQASFGHAVRSSRGGPRSCP